jgi:hypothetical protein
MQSPLRFHRTEESRLISSCHSFRRRILNAYASIAAAKASIASWTGFYNEERQHQSLDCRTPRQAYEAECPWMCGRPGSPSGCAFVHIATGTTANTGSRRTRRTQKRRHDRRAGHGGSRYRNRPGDPLDDGSGCLTIGIHLTGRDFIRRIGKTVGGCYCSQRRDVAASGTNAQERVELDEATSS